MFDDETAAFIATSSLPEPERSGEDLCREFLEHRPITGASLSVITWPGHHSTVFANDPTAERIDTFQHDLGEGPRWKAWHTDQPVNVPNTSWHELAEFPIFGAAVQEIAVGSLFAFPMLLENATLGVVDLYHANAGALGTENMVKARNLANDVAESAIRLAVWSARHPISPVAKAPELRREVHQATGMIITQLGVGAQEAFARLRGLALVRGDDVEDIAHKVITHQLDFRDLSD